MSYFFFVFGIIQKKMSSPPPFRTTEKMPRPPPICDRMVRSTILKCSGVTVLLVGLAIGLCFHFLISTKHKCKPPQDMNLKVDWAGFRDVRDSLQEGWIRDLIPHVHALVLPERMGKFYPILMALKINPDITIGVTPSELQKDTTLPVHGQLQSIPVTPEICCLFGHYKMMQRFIEQGRPGELAVFFEDDLAIPLDFRAIETFLTSLVSSSFLQTRTKPSICYLGSCYGKTKGPPVMERLYHGAADCMHAYILNYEGAKLVCEAFLTMYNGIGCDTVLQRLARQGRIDSYLVRPSLLKQNKTEFGTYIGNSLHGRGHE